VVVLSALSLHAATARSASADAEARIILFMSFTYRPKIGKQSLFVGRQVHGVGTKTRGPAPRCFK